MPAYIVVDVQINDHKLYEEYKKLVPASLAAYDGKFIVSGGETETLEGNWKPSRFVMLEFPDANRAREWWNSSEYAKAKSLRQSAASTQMILAEGYNKT